MFSPSSAGYASLIVIIEILTNDKLKDGPPEKPKRKIVKYDNLGDPVYEDEINATNESSIEVFGKRVSVDPISANSGIFGIIAFNFIVLANL